MRERESERERESWAVTRDWHLIKKQRQKGGHRGKEKKSGRDFGAKRNVAVEN